MQDKKQWLSTSGKGSAEQGDVSQLKGARSRKDDTFLPGKLSEVELQAQMSRKKAYSDDEENHEFRWQASGSAVLPYMRI